MEKRIVLVDFQSERKEFKIKNFENVVTIEIKILSGDEVAKIIYKDGSIITFDSSGDRFMNYYDDDYHLPLDLLNSFNKLKGSSYEKSYKILEIIKRNSGRKK